MDQGLVELLKELCEPIGAVSFRRMFGGVGLFGPDGMFALVADDTFYLKSDAETAALFDAEALEPFSYVAKGDRRVLTSYRRAPERLFDEPEEFRDWARRSMAVAARAAAARAKPAPRKAKPAVRPAR